MHAQHVDEVRLDTHARQKVTSRLQERRCYKSYRTHGTVDIKSRALAQDFLFSRIP